MEVVRIIMDLKVPESLKESDVKDNIVLESKVIESLAKKRIPFIFLAIGVGEKTYQEIITLAATIGMTAEGALRKLQESYMEMLRQSSSLQK